MASIARLCSRWGSRTRRRRSRRRRPCSASLWSWRTTPARSSLARKRQGGRRGISISAVRTERTAHPGPLRSRFRTSRRLGAGERIRTADLPLTRRTLCQLSYTGVIGSGEPDPESLPGYRFLPAAGNRLQPTTDALGRMSAWKDSRAPAALVRSTRRAAAGTTAERPRRRPSSSCAPAIALSRSATPRTSCGHGTRPPGRARSNSTRRAGGPVSPCWRPPAAGSSTATGTVSFRAIYVLDGQRHVLTENSKFVREGKRWLYLGPAD